MNEKDDCMAFEIIKREAAATLDDSPRSRRLKNVFFVTDAAAK
jgi:hypothetical protein